MSPASHTHPRRPIVDRFWPKVETQDDGCWVWRGARLPKGYGVIGRGGRSGGYLYAHRLSWEIHVGPIPQGMVVMHICDNPPCVRPEHLSLGTRAENNRDMAAKGRHVSKLTRGQVISVRASVAAGESIRGAARRLGVYPQVVRHAVIGNGWALPDERRTRPAPDG